jgi:PAS domain S-box-containing protein
MNLYLGFLLALVIIVSTTIISISIRKRSAPGAISLIFFAIGLLIWSITYIFFFYASQSWIYYWLGAAYLFSSLARLSLFIFSIQYTNNDHWLNKRTFGFFLIEPIITQVILWTNHIHGFFFARRTIELFGQTYQIGPWFWISAVYNYSLLLITILIITQSYIRLSRMNRKLLGLLLFGAIAPVVLYVATLAGSAIIPGAELSPAVFIIPGVTLVIGLLKYRLLDYSIQTRDGVIEIMNDGWLVLDDNNQVIDINPIAEQLINRPRKEIFGLSVEAVLTDWPNVIRQINNNTVILDTNFSVEMNNTWRYFNLRVQPLTNANKRLIGHVIFWRDITEQKMVDDARKQARDEMFLLLHGLASAASEASNLQSFLSDSVYLILSVFQCQSISIFLLDENQHNGEPSKLSLVNQVGLSAQIAKKLTRLTVRHEKAGGMFNEILVKRQTFTSLVINNDPLVPVELQDLGPGTLLAAPLRSNDEMLGLVCIVRKPGVSYYPEEIFRFTAAAEEISNFIYNDRQRQLAIALAERARLVRDLHDSVTQKLYGLLALTEAAQAGLEMGSTEMSTKVLVPIGENARQALKEMRLFLYELTPSNLKKDGLIAVLNQRLDAVEGRADIKRKIISDENISLTYDQQVAFFYIAQEALNNTLRHAQAKSVLIRLKQTKNHIVMEMEDDGLGFDADDYKQGGIGLRSMRERTEQIGATLKMHSEPGKGTKIVLSLRKDGEQHG